MKFSNNNLLPVVVLTGIINNLTLGVYLPLAPHIADHFAVSPSYVRLGIIFYLFSYSLSQLIVGVTSDYLGRRLPLLICLVLYCMTVSACSISKSVYMLIFFQTLLGLAVGLSTLARTILRDKLCSDELIEGNATLSIFASLVLLFSPLLGSFIFTLLGWKMVFVLLLIYGLIFLLYVYFQMEETLAERTNLFSLKNILTNVQTILRNVVFLRNLILVVITFSGVIIYDLLAPFVFEDDLHFSSVEYASTIFITMGGYLLGNYVVRGSLARYSKNHVLNLMACLMLISGIILYVATHFSSERIVAFFIIFAMFGYMMSYGVIFPICISTALEPFPTIAGMASAIAGFINMTFTALITLILNAVKETNSVVLAVSILMLTFLCFISLFFKSRQPE